MFPGEWRGLENEELEKRSGINGLRFIHMDGWKAKARNKEALIRLIESSGENRTEVSTPPLLKRSTDRKNP